MVYIIDKLPENTPVVERMRARKADVQTYAGYTGHLPGQPERTERVTGISYDGQKLPRGLAGKLQKYGFQAPEPTDVDRYRKELKTFIDDKPLYLRGKPRGAHPDWFALVSEEFEPIDINDISRRLKGLTDGREPVIRDFRGDSSLVLAYPLESRLPGLETLNLHADLGRYGAWGGDGLSAVRYGLSHHNGACTNWTLFLHDDLVRRRMRGRIIHRGDTDAELDSIKDSLGDWTGKVVTALEQSRGQQLYKEDLEAYVALYEKRGLNDGIARNLLRDVGSAGLLAHGVDAGISAHEAAYRITKHCQTLSNTDAARKRLEYLAGELILCTDKVLATVRQKKPEKPAEATDPPLTEFPPAPGWAGMDDFPGSDYN
jgi:hypothetical protein